jgi:hypothetical protein
VALAPELLASLNSTQFDVLDSQEIGVLTTAQLNALTSTSLDVIESTAFSLLSSADLAAISTRALALVIDSGQLAALDSTQVVALSPALVASLGSTQFNVLDSRELSALTTAQLSSMGAAAFFSISSAEFTAFSTTQLAGFSSAQFSALNSTQILGLDSADIASLGSVFHGAALTSTQLDAMFATVINDGLHSNQIGTLGTVANLTTRFGFTTPVVLDLNGDGIQTVNIADGVSFDVNNDGFVERSAWVLNSDGLLVRDINGDGVINNGGELFGSGTVLPDGSKAADGYIAMRALDTNMDGLLDANDQAFGELKVWRDANGDGKTDAGELLSLNQLNVTSISLNATVGTEVNNGNILGLMGSYTTADGKTHTMGDVWFQVDESGKQVFDLAAVAKAAGSANINLSKTDAQTLNVTLADVLAVGAPDILSGSTQVTITGDSGDTVQLDGGSGWSLAGTTTDGADTYMVYVNQNAHLLVNDKIHTIIV